MMTEQILAAQKSGNHLMVYELAEEALKTHPDDIFLQYHLVLALAKCDATQRALDCFYHYKLYLHPSEDVLALEALILKHLAFASYDAVSLRKAADSYHRILSQAGGYYRAINAATLYLLSGDRGQSVALAQHALELAAQDEGDLFFKMATQAAALLMLDRQSDAKQVIDAVACLEGDNLQRRARTRQRLKLICDYLHLDASILDSLLPETVVYYCGHIFDQTILPEQEAELVRRIESILSENKVAIAYGSLAAGADILFAECILQRGGELNVWLPFKKSDFCEAAVQPAGAAWLARFESCLARAHSVSYATDSSFMKDDSLFEYCADVSMGMSIMRANILSARVLQVAVWNEIASARFSGTRRNVNKWRDLGHSACVIPYPHSSHVRKVLTQPDVVARREPHAILFSDVRGYSKLCDRDVLWYFNVLNPHLARSIEKFRPDIQLIDTWGDGIYMITKKASVAARIAFELNEALAQLDQSMLDLQEPLMMRTALHYGPVFTLYDHFEQKETFSSNEVTKTARIEPVTPPGEIFGTEAFVAILELEGDKCATFEYAGTLPSAKNYGAFSMFHIRPGLQSDSTWRVKKQKA